MEAARSEDRRRRLERLARLCFQSQQRQQVPGRPALPRPVRAAPGFRPGWAGQNSPEAAAATSEEF